MTRPATSPSAGNSTLDQRLERAQALERERGLERRCPAIEGRVGLRYRLDGRPVTSLCSNDYLGLADELAAASDPAPSGSAASRLVCGDLPEHRAIERAFAEFLGSEDAVLFPSGFQANVGVPACLLQQDDVAHSDALNHASMIDGLRLAAAERRIIPHLERPPARVAAPGLSWWFTESVFSMDGDGPTLADLDAHLERGGCLYLDEAHALGLGLDGRGRAAELTHAPTLIIAPLGKAFGCAGAFVAGSRVRCEWIRSHARAFVFTTGTAPILLPRIADALACVRGPAGEARRARLWANVDRLRAALELPARDPRQPPSPILPWIVGPNAAALALSHALLERGWHVQAIRPPTVPEGSARLRITVSAAHEPDDLDRFAADLRSCAHALGLTSSDDPARDPAFMPAIGAAS